MLKLKSFLKKSALNNSNKKPISKPLVLALHIVLIGAGSLGVYSIATKHDINQQHELTKAYTRQASLVIDRHALEWQEKAQMLAQQPMLQSDASLKAVIPPDGTIPPSLSYTDQDLLNRTREAPTQPEISGTGDKAVVSTALAMPGGGYALFAWPIEPLTKDLKAITPADIEIRFTQALNGGSPLEVLRVNSSGNDGHLNKVELKIKGWELYVGSKAEGGNTPMILALISLIAGCISLLPWLLRKENPAVIPVVKESNELEHVFDSLNPLHPQGDVSPANNHLDSEVNLAEPLPDLSHTDIANVFDDIDGETGTAKSKLVLDKEEELLAEENAEQAKEEQLPPGTVAKKDMIEFSLDDALFPDLDFTAPVVVFPAKLFRAYDIRGSIELLTPSLIEKTGRALGAAFRAKDQYQVVVGYDARASSPSYAKLVRQALSESGLTVIDIGLVPTPLMHFAARDYDMNGIMVTASHNPGDENGLKWIINGQSPTPEDIQAIRARVEAQDFVSGLGSIREHDYKEAYLNMLQDDVVLTQPFNIAIDGMNGSMGELALAAFKAAGCEVSAMNTEPNGMFPNGAPDPSQAANLTDLSNDIAISGCSVGFAFDGDGDRVTVLDGRGEMVSPDQLISLFAQMLLDQNPGSDVIFDVKCSRIVSSTITSHGGRPVMVRTGNTFLRRALNDPQYQAVFAGEFAGHYFFNDGRGQGRDDGLYAALRLLEWLDQQDWTIDQALARLPKRYSTPELLLPLNDLDANSLISQLGETAGRLDHAKLSTIDGIRLDFDTGFGIIRPSNTGAHLTARFDADTADDLDAIRTTFANLLQPYDERLAQLIQQ